MVSKEEEITMSEEISKDIIRGHVNAIVLNILSQHDSYGYEISKTVKELSQGRYLINEATLYTVFRRLEKAGEISSYWGDETQGGRRKYYKITETGKQQLVVAQHSWVFAKEIINILVTGQIGGKTNEQ
jgi:PadR family transcriptional regulator PadR